MAQQPAHWRLGSGRSLALDRGRLLAIINVTPDSFSDGGQTLTPKQALERAALAVAEGADMLDIGGESTRPGASRVDQAEQIRRVIPAIRAIRDAGITAPVSVDTTLAAVAEAAIDVGADAINDVSAGREDSEMFALAARSGAGLILMHRAAPPAQDVYSDRHTQEPQFDGGVVAEVRRFLLDRAEAAIRVGVDPASVVIDPGLGFGKSVAQNFALIAHAEDFLSTGFAVISAASRKSFIGAACACPEPQDRVEGSVAVTVAQRGAGVRLFRVHDIRAHARALRTAEAILDARDGGNR